MVEVKREYRDLSSEENRRLLVENMKQVRRDALVLIRAVPPQSWYKPRYHGWTPAFLIAHLQIMDNATLRLMQLAMRGISIPSTLGLINVLNDVSAKLFRQRKVENTIHRIQTDEPHLISFVLRAPKDQLQRVIYDPAIEKRLTVEQAMQEFFVYHWRWHMGDMQAVDGRAEGKSAEI